MTNKNVCKCPECPEKLSIEEIKNLALALDETSCKIDDTNTANGGDNMTGEIHVVFLNGQRFSLQFNQIKNILVLRQEIRKRLGIDECKQKLIFNGVELQVIHLSIFRGENWLNFVLNLNLFYHFVGSKNWNCAYA